MIAVLDTNVVVSGMITPRGVCAEILRRVNRNVFLACVTDAILREYEEVLTRPHLNIDLAKARDVLAMFERLALNARPQVLGTALPDPDDKIFLAVARVVEADYLVTGNLRHFPPQLCQGVRIISPAEFLKLLPS
jgi:putative PIN family toxin of toxin-antitoxin system